MASSVYLHLPVSERCDHQTISAAQILITVIKFHISDLDYASICILFEVEAGLFPAIQSLTMTGCSFVPWVEHKKAMWRLEVK